MKFNLLILVLSFTLNSFGKEVFVNLVSDSIVFKSFNYKITVVEDCRKDTSIVGFSIGAINNNPIKVINGLQNSFLNYANNIIESNIDAIPIKLKIKELIISEKDLAVTKEATGKLSCEYFDLKDNLIYMTDHVYVVEKSKMKKEYAKIIKQLINKSMHNLSLYDINSDIYYNLLNQINLHDSIILADNFKKGFYANLYEFQANNPSLIFDFEINNVGKGKKSRSYLKFKHEEDELKGILDIAFGFSDGKDIYIKRRLSYGYTFEKVVNFGRYAYIGKRLDSQAIPIVLPVVVGIMTIPVEEDYFLDIGSGKTYPVTDETIRIILRMDPPTYEAFLNQPSKRQGAMGLYWIEQYNNQYKLKINKR